MVNDVSFSKIEIIPFSLTHFFYKHILAMKVTYRSAKVANPNYSKNEGSKYISIERESGA